MATARRKLPQHAQDAIDDALQALGQIEREPEKVYRLIAAGKISESAWGLGEIRVLAQRASRLIESIEVEGRR